MILDKTSLWCNKLTAIFRFTEPFLQGLLFARTVCLLVHLTNEMKPSIRKLTNADVLHKLMNECDQTFYYFSLEIVRNFFKAKRNVNF